MKRYAKNVISQAKKQGDPFDYKRHAALTISSWFCMPEQKMEKFEILSRASCFLVNAKDPEKFGRRHHLVTVGHTVAPWRWPNYYPEGWLRDVNEKHTYYTMELRRDDGIFLTQIDLIPRSYHHLTKDICVLHVNNESHVDKIAAFFSVHGETLLPPDIMLSDYQTLEFHGHDVTLPGGFDDHDLSKEDNRVPVPTVIRGKMAFQSDMQVFAAAESLLTDGMCGGPIYIKRDELTSEQKKQIDSMSPSSKSDRYVCGMIGGIVRLDNPIVDLRGHVSVIKPADIMQLLDAIEGQRADELIGLLGGDSVKHVATGQKVSRSDLAKTLGPYIE